MADINSMFNSFFGFVGQMTGGIRGLVNNIAPQQSTLVILALSAAGGYYLSKRWPKLDSWQATIAYSLLIFLLLRFV